MVNKKQEFYMQIKAILDKQELLDDAKELRDLLSDVKMDFDSEEFEKAVRRVVKKLSKQTMAHITRGLNEAIKALGGKPIALEELIQKPNLQMWEAWGSSIGDLIGQGITTGIESAMKKATVSIKQSFMKDLSDISSAAKRMIKKNGTINRDRIKEILTDVDYEVSSEKQVTPREIGEEMALVKRQYAAEGKTWDQRYAALLKYKKLYEALLDRVGADSIPKKLKNIGGYTYEQIVEALPQIQASLQNVFNMLSGKELFGLTKGGTVDINVVPVIADELNPYDLVKGRRKGKVEIEVTPITSSEPGKDIGTINGQEQSSITEEEVRRVENAFEDVCRQVEDLIRRLAEAQKELEKLQNSAEIFGFGSDKTPTAEGKIRSTLSKPKNKQYPNYSRNQYVVDQLKQGRTLTESKDGVYGFNRDDLGEGVINPLTKTEYEYAKYLSDKIKELNVGWDEGLKVLQSQNGQLERAKQNVVALETLLESGQQAKDAAYKEQAKIHNAYARQQSGLAPIIDNESKTGQTTGDMKPGGQDGVSIDEKQLRAVLEAITYNVKIIADNDDTEPNKVVIDEQSLKMALQSMASGLKNPATGDEDDGSTQAPWALEETLKGQTNTKLDAIKAALEGIGAQEKTVPAPTTETGFATENTLGSIKAAVEAINQKVVKGTKASTSEGGARQKSSGGSASSQPSVEKLKTQEAYLAKFTAKLLTTGKLTDDVAKEIKRLFAELKKVNSGTDLSNWNQQFLRLKTSVGITDIFEGATEKGVAASYEELIEFQKLRNKLELEYVRAKDGSTLKQSYKEQLDLMDSVIAKQQVTQKNDKYEAELTKIRLEHERKLTVEIKKQADKAQEMSDKQALKLAKKQAMVGKAGSAVNRAENTYLGALSMDVELPEGFEDKLEDYRKKYEALRIIQDKVNNSKIIDPKDVEALKQQTVEVNKLTTEMSELLAQYQKFSGPNVKDLGVSELAPGATLEQQKNYLTTLAKSYFDGKVSIQGFNDATGELIATVQGKGSRAITTYTMGITQLDNKVKAAATSTRMAEGFFEALKRKFNEIKSYISAMSIFSFFIQQIKQGIQYVKEVDLALTELRKVTDETEETYDEFLKTAAKTGEKLGSTISAVTEATATFAKLGYSMKQASEMAEAALVYKNVGDNIESAEDAADSIISTLKGFGMEASEAMAIVDRFNEVGNKFAITSRGIGEALMLSASALSEGGNSLDESIAMITGANEVVNDPNSVGTALKTLTLRLRGKICALLYGNIQAMYV